MITREYMNGFIEKYKENNDISYELTDKLLQKCDQLQWFSYLSNRSKSLRNIYAENEQLLKEFREKLREPFTEETAELLYDGIMDLYHNAYDDMAVLQPAALRLISYYEDRQDIEHLIPLYHLMAFEYTEIFCRVYMDKSPYEPYPYYSKIIDLEQDYLKIKSPDTRKYFFKAYTNVVAPLCQIYPELLGRIYEFYDRAKALWANPEVQALDGDNVDIQESMEQLEEDFMFAEEYLSSFSEQDRERFLKQIEAMESQYANPSEDYSGCYKRAYVKCQLLRNKITREEAIWDLVEYLAIHLQDLDYQAEDEQRTFLEILNYHNTIITILDFMKGCGALPSDLQERLYQLFDRVNQILSRIPYTFHTGIMNNVCSEHYSESVSYFRNVEDKKRYLMDLILCRQPSTYIHSLMVREIAKLLGAVLLEDGPELFVGIPGYETRELVIEKREELLDFIMEAALLHDIGKCTIVDVINLQTRRLTEDEFEMIKLHPEKGRQILHEDPDFASFYPIMLGHHKFYDGTKGYPADFDNVGSPMRPVIDLITICDCIDAATDLQGRNYAKGKRFEQVFEELKAQAGTRYHPQMIQLMENHPELLEKLAWLTTLGRIDIYYQAYQHILSLGDTQE